MGELIRGRWTSDGHTKYLLRPELLYLRRSSPGKLDLAATVTRVGWFVVVLRERHKDICRVSYLVYTYACVYIYMCVCVCMRKRGERDTSVNK
jgi:hypothetical protein